MQFMGKNDDRFLIEMDNRMLIALIVSMNHVVVAPPGNRQKYVLPRVEAELAEVESVRQALGALEHSSRRRLTISTRELTVIIRALDELANGFRIQEWEFHSLTGFNRQEIRDYLGQMHKLIVNRGRDLELLVGPI